eukprot:m.367011 g.367011  ORF g.367011 m.367011 type:complete len:195 (+) comp28097_c0_seq13:39-623(+)
MYSDETAFEWFGGYHAPPLSVLVSHLPAWWRDSRPRPHLIHALHRGIQMRKADIVLWGCSIGSGPTVNLAQLEGARTSIGGVIIESGIASVINAGWGIVRGRDETLGGAGRMIARSTLDFFVNYTKIGKIERPICIVHGTADKIVSVSNAKLNLQNVQGASKHPPLFVEGKGHNNLDIPYGEAGRHIAHFLRAL